MSVSVMRIEERPVRSVSLGALWFGLLAGPLAWMVQELVGYGLAAQACGAEGPRPIPLAPALGVAELIVSGAAVFLAGTGLVTALLAWRRVARHRSDGDEAPDIGDERSAFMALAGMITGLFFLFGVLMNAVGYFLIPPCG
jgi:hypothetical protein